MPLKTFEPFVVRILRERLERCGQRPGRVDHSVEVSPPFPDQGERRINRCRIREVGAYPESVSGTQPLELLFCRCKSISRPGQHRHAGSIGRETLGCGPTHAARTAGHDDGRAAQSQIHLAPVPKRRSFHGPDRAPVKGDLATPA